MIEYNDIKDLIIYNDPIFGEISIEFIINAIKELIKKQKQFENIIYNILKNLNMEDQDISSLLNLSTSNILEMYLKMLTDEL